MLHEVPVAQKEKGSYRRWFEDEYFQLIVWYDLKTKTISSFQLCYDIEHNAHCLTWKNTDGFTHNTLDDGYKSFRHPSSPVLLSDGVFPVKSIVKKLIDSSSGIDKSVSKYVIYKISEFGSYNLTKNDIAKISKKKTRTSAKLMKLEIVENDSLPETNFDDEKNKPSSRWFFSFVDNVKNRIKR